MAVINYNALANLARELDVDAFQDYPVKQRGRLAEDNELKVLIRGMNDGSSLELAGVFNPSVPELNKSLQMYIGSYARTMGLRIKTKRNLNGTDLALYKLTEAEIAEDEAEKARQEAAQASLAVAGTGEGSTPTEGDEN